jgi:transcriptional regulator with PAS, ATPase and Fis domain
MEYNSEEVLTAWKAFVGRGTLLEGNLQPAVARSWQRCKEQGLDPWSVDFAKPSKELLRKKRQENEILLTKSQPVLEYLMGMFNCNLTLCDREGFIFELMTPLDYYPRTYGTYMDEALTGNGSVTVALREKKPCRLDGYEHYRIVSQGYSGVSAPIEASGHFYGVLTITNPFASLPDYALDCCIEGSSIISEFMQEGNHQSKLMATANVFGRIIEKSNKAIIVLDYKGRILLANRYGKEIAFQFDQMPYGAQSLGEYLIDRNALNILLDFSQDADNEMTFTFKSNRSLKKPSLQLLFRKKVHLPNGLVHIVVGFESPTVGEEKKAKPILRNSQLTVDYIGNSTAWKKVDQVVQKVAKFNTNVLLLGETGTGKEVVARAIHRLSGRTGKFVAVNCGAIPKELFASELFGYESGAFTGARAGGSTGKFEYAHEGTLFLDEIGEMPLDMQVSLLRVIQEKTITRIGSNKSQPCDVRIIAATNQEMKKVIDKGEFRSDLYYRLSVVEIKLPLLKDRKSDIALLAEYFNGHLSEQLQISHHLLSNEVINELIQYDWPGNVRELRNVIEKMLILSEGNPITVDLVPDFIREKVKNSDVMLYHSNENPSSERERICISLEKHRGNISQVAKELGIARNTLYRKLEKYHIEIKTFALEKD